MLKTYSTFYYGHTINEDNFYFPIIFNGETFNVNISIGAYTFTDFVSELSRALNTVEGINFELQIDRKTRFITISADAEFIIPISSSVLKNSSCYSLAGFEGTADLIGSATYTGAQGSGSVFSPQFLLQKYIDFEDDQEASASSISESGSGVIQAVSFGQIKRMTCNIRYQTNIIPQGVIKEDPEGYDNLRKFLLYITTKAPIEFMRDEDNPFSYVECFLDRTASSKEGTGFKIKELYAQGIADYFESGNLVFRELNI